MPVRVRMSGQDVGRGDVPANQCTRGTQVPGVGTGRTSWCGGSGGVPPLDDESMPSTDVDDGHLVPCLPDAALLDAEVRAKRPRSREQMAFVVTIIPATAGLGPSCGQSDCQHRPGRGARPSRPGHRRRAPHRGGGGGRDEGGGVALGSERRSPRHARRCSSRLRLARAGSSHCCCAYAVR